MIDLFQTNGSSPPKRLNMTPERELGDALEGEQLARRAEKYTGESRLVIRMNQGGVTTSDISATKRLFPKRGAQ